MDRECLESVIGHSYDGVFRDALLEGFVRLQPSFYMVFEDEEGSVEGKLIMGLSAEDIAHLDRYEGVRNGMYRRKWVTVEISVEELAPEYTVDSYVYYNGP